MDRNMAAQMAALTAYSPAKLIGGQTTTIPPTAPATTTSGASSAASSGGTNSAPSHSPSLSPVMNTTPHQQQQQPQQQQQQQQQYYQQQQQQSQQQPQQQQPQQQFQQQTQQQHWKQQRLSLCQSLAAQFSQRGTPLPPSLTSVPVPNYDHATSQWSILDIHPTEPGVIRIAGKDIDLFFLYKCVLTTGGYQKVTANDHWQALLPQFELPVTYNGASTAALLQKAYSMLLALFEDTARNNAANRQRSTMARQGPSASGPDAASTPQAQSTPAAADTPQPTLPPSSSNGSSPNEGTTRAPSSSHDINPDGLKRKLASEDADPKRARVKTEASESSIPTTGSSNETKHKIAYVPLAHEVTEYGGRDMVAIDQVYRQRNQRFTTLSEHEWETVNMDALALSIRSRLATELSYAITTMALISVMTAKGQPGSGINVANCKDVIDELVDLLADTAFEEEDAIEPMDEPTAPPTSLGRTHRELTATMKDCNTQLFTGIIRDQGTKNWELGPKARPGDIVLAILNIFRNLSCVFDNRKTLAQHPRFLDVILRISCIHEASLPPQAVAPALSLTDVLTARKDITLILSHLGSYIDFGSPEGVSPPLIALRRARRLFGLLSSFLVDENEALPPGELVFKTTGLPPSSQSRVPNQVDLALDALVRTAVPDVNRRVLGLALSEIHLWTLVTALVRRLPVAEIDYTLLDPASGPHAGQWLAYVEKLLLALHSILFSTTPAFKKRVARSAKLALPRTLLRLVRRWTAMTDATLPSMQGTGHGHGHGRPDLRQLYATGAMRAVEVLHVVDDAVDEYGAVDGAAASSATLLTFGMGYGEGAENDLKPGTGLLGGYQEEVALSIMMMRDLEGSMFHELESLVRVE